MLFVQLRFLTDQQRFLLWNQKVRTFHSDLSGRKSDQNLKKQKIDENIGILKNESNKWLKEAILY